MAHLSKEMIANIKANVKTVCAKYGIKATVSIEGGFTPVLNVNIKSGEIDFISNYNETHHSKLLGPASRWEPAVNYVSVNPYHFKQNFSEKALDFLTEIYSVINEGNHDKSDSQTDYFDVGWYAYAHVGRWDKPYQLTA